MLPILQAGTIARYDAYLNGLIPCKVVSIVRSNWGNAIVTVKVTRSTGGHKAGETIVTGVLNVAPVTAVKRRKYSTVFTPYNWKFDCDAEGVRRGGNATNDYASRNASLLSYDRIEVIDGNK